MQINVVFDAATLPPDTAAAGRAACGAVSLTIHPALLVPAAAGHLGRLLGLMLTELTSEAAVSQ